MLLRAAWNDAAGGSARDIGLSQPFLIQRVKRDDHPAGALLVGLSTCYAGETEPRADVAESRETTELVEAVRGAVRRPPEDLREAVLLCEWEDLPVAAGPADRRPVPGSCIKR